MLQCQLLPCPLVDENVLLLPVPHIVPQHPAGVAGQLHGLGRIRDVTPGSAVVLALWEGDLAGAAVPQLDPGFQDIPGSGGGLVDLFFKFLNNLFSIS